eukprot:6513115-Alexandrium_andersonii.AAC.1
MSASLVGSEMCIRDRLNTAQTRSPEISSRPFRGASRADSKSGDEKGAASEVPPGSCAFLRGSW